MSAVPMMKKEFEREFVYLNIDCWINKESDVEQPIVVLKDPTTIPAYKDVPFKLFKAGSKIPTDWYDTSYIHGLGAIHG